MFNKGVTYSIVYESVDTNEYFVGKYKNENYKDSHTFVDEEGRLLFVGTTDILEIEEVADL